MADLFGESVSREELAARVGRIEQVAGARPFVFSEGPARGMRGIDLWTGAGLTLTVLPDRCLDILTARFRGMPLAWESATGPVAPERYDPEGFRWLRSFGGGLLTTCGLRHFGAPEAEGDEAWGLHGRASNLSADQVAVDCSWQGDAYRIAVRGHVDEAEVFRPTLRLERTIETALGACHVTVRDRVTNLGFAASSAMLLYHINLGWPLVSEYSELVVAQESIRGVTDEAQAAVDRHGRFLPPTEGFSEHTYEIEPKRYADGTCRAALVNPELGNGLGVTLAWQKDAMPYMAEWKMMGQGTYVVGIEPTTCPFPPRQGLRDRGQMPELATGETRETGFRLGVVQGPDELDGLRAWIEGD